MSAATVSAPASPVPRWALWVALAVVAANVAAWGLTRAFHSPGGPTSSTFATAPSGLAAFHDLAASSGFGVTRSRTSPASAPLDPSATLVVLDPGVLPGEDVAALRAFVDGGGRLVAGGRYPMSWLPRLVDEPPEWRPFGSPEVTTALPSADLPSVRAVSAAGEGSWSDPGAGAVVLGSAGSSLVVAQQSGAGRVLLVADASALQNRLLGEADNAAFGLDLLGDPARPVVFVESVHGFASGGWAALPAGWRWAASGVLLGIVLWLWARGRRLAPPVGAATAPPPARKEYIDSMAGLLARTRDPAGAIAPLRRALMDRAALHAAGAADDASAQARRAGLNPEEVDSLLAQTATDESALVLGRAYTRIGGR